MSINNSEKQIIDEIISLMQRDDSIDAPQDAIKWSKNIFRTRAVAPKLSLVQKVLAVLQMDLSPNKAAFGERSAGVGQERQMLFSAGENGIDLRIKEAEKGFSVRGQILGEGFAGATVKFGDFETVASELGEFSFTDMPNGEYDMTLKTGETEITIEKLQIK
ncbi:MAG: hypothetical protein WA584_21415 [Pyrinomonadaceae bacterium]